MRIYSVNSVRNVPQNNGTAFKNAKTKPLANLATAAAVTLGSLFAATSCSGGPSDKEIQNDLNRIRTELRKEKKYSTDNIKQKPVVTRSSDYISVTGPQGSVVSFNPKYVNVTVSGISVSCIPDYSETFSKICPNGYISNKVDLIYLVELMQKDISTVEECGIFPELDIRMVRFYAVIDAAQQIIDQIEYEE